MIVAECVQYDSWPETLGGALRSRLGDHWEPPWHRPAHGFACVGDNAAAATVCLTRLEAVLTRIDLSPLLPAALRCAVRKRQLSFVGGRLCAERCLGRLGCPATLALVKRGAQGQPLWPERFRGSITHNDVLASAIAAHADLYGGIGIDSEQMVGSADEIVQRCCTAYERSAWLSRMQTRCLVATLLFSLKESFYKAIHPTVNRFVDFDEVEVASWDASRSQVHFRPVSGSGLAPFTESARASYRVGDGTMPSVHTAVLLLGSAPSRCL